MTLVSAKLNQHSKIFKKLDHLKIKNFRENLEEDCEQCLFIGTWSTDDSCTLYCDIKQKTQTINNWPVLFV